MRERRRRYDQRPAPRTARRRESETYDVDHGAQEVDEDGDEDDDVAGGVRLVDPAARRPQHQRETLVVLRRGHEDQAGVEDDEHRELDHHGNRPAQT